MLPILPLLSMLLAPLSAAHADPLDPHGFRQPSRAQRLACPDLKRIDFAAVARQARPHLAAFNADTIDAHKTIRGPIPYPAPGDAGLILSAIGSATITQDRPTRTSSVIWRDRSGRWMMDRVDFIDPIDLQPRPGAAPYTEAERARMSRRHAAGPLATALARQLDAALASRCFALEPDWLSLPIPALRDGGPPQIEGYPGSGGTVRFQRGGKSWTMYHENPRAQFRIILEAVLYAQPELANGNQR